MNSQPAGVGFISKLCFYCLISNLYISNMLLWWVCGVILRRRAARRRVCVCVCFSRDRRQRCSSSLSNPKVWILTCTVNNHLTQSSCHRHTRMVFFFRDICGVSDSHPFYLTSDISATMDLILITARQRRRQWLKWFKCRLICSHTDAHLTNRPGNSQPAGNNELACRIRGTSPQWKCMCMHRCQCCPHLKHKTVITTLFLMRSVLIIQRDASSHQL